MITVLREELGDLPPSDRRLILVLAGNPRVPYAEINARLGIPVGSIGPTRCRCLDKTAPPPAHCRPDQRRHNRGQMRCAADEMADMDAVRDTCTDGLRAPNRCSAPGHE